MDAKLKELFTSILQVPESRLTRDLAMRDVDTWDSLRHMELVAGVEQAFGLELTFEEIVTMQTAGAVEDVLRKRGALKS